MQCNAKGSLARFWLPFDVTLSKSDYSGPAKQIMNNELACLSVLSVFAVLSGVALLWGRPDWLLWLLVAAKAMGGFNWYWGGTLVFPIKLTMVFGLLYLVFHADTWSRNVETTGNRILWLCLGAVALSVAMAFIIPLPDIAILSSGPQSRLLRPLVQAYTYTATLAIFPLVLTALNSKKKLLRFCDWYMAVALCSGVVGIVQLVMIHTGREFMPILRWNIEHSEVAAFEASEATVLRLYAFAGEPKTLSVFLLPALFMVLASFATGNAGRRPWWSRWWALAIIGVAFVFAFSTAALIAFAVGLVFLGRVVALRGMGALIAFAAGVLILAGAVLGASRLAGLKTRTDSGQLRTGMTEVLYGRVIGRLFETGDSLYEVRALEYMFKQKPKALFAGLGPGMYVFHFGETWAKGVNWIDSGWVALFMDLGILGTVLLLVWLYHVWSRSVASVRHHRSGDAELLRVQVISLASFVAAVFLNAGISALAFICLFAGVLEAARVQSNQRLLPSCDEPGQAVYWKSNRWVPQRQKRRKKVRSILYANREESPAR